MKDFPGGSVAKNLAANAVDRSSIWPGKIPHAMVADIKTASILDNFQGSSEVPCWAILTKDPLMYLIPLLQLDTLISAPLSDIKCRVSSPSQAIYKRT